MPAIDVAIIGAGPVGATIAALCAGSGRDIALFDARNGPSRDARTLALSHSSRILLEEARAWPPEASTPITSIHVSQKGGPGRTLITAAEHGLPALGHTVGYAALEGALERLLAESSIPIHYARSCEKIVLEPERATVHFASGDPIQARLLVLADGGANAARIPGIGFGEKDYSQRAVVGALRASRAHEGRAYERFTPQGPVALLPVGERFAFVWTAAPEEATRLLALDDAAFLAALQEHFGDRAGRFLAIGERAAFPLRLRAVNSPVALRTAIVGNAAQSLHPIAGQGLNLGLRDAATLAELITRTDPDQLGARAMLDEYRQLRRRDSSRGIAFTDLLVSLFADGRRIPTWSRGIGLAALDLLPPVRRLFAERMIRGAPAP